MRTSQAWGSGDRPSQLVADYVTINEALGQRPDDASFLKREPLQSYSVHCIKDFASVYHGFDPESICRAVRAAKFMQRDMRATQRPLEELWLPAFTKADATYDRVAPMVKVLDIVWAHGNRLHDIVMNQHVVVPFRRSAPSQP